MDVVERARRYLARIGPAITGQHGDLHTFRVCCRIVRGFALNEEEALAVLTEWNERCPPPRSVRDLRDRSRGPASMARNRLGGCAEVAQRVLVVDP